MIMNGVSNETLDPKALMITDNLAGGPQIKGSRDGKMQCHIAHGSTNFGLGFCY